MAADAHQQRFASANPCVRNCCLNEHDFCLGCFRHISEIQQWYRLTDKQKQVILTECQYRARDMHRVAGC